MPKMNTKSGAKKRFRVQSGGGIKRAKAFLRHILTKKSSKRKRHLRGTTTVFGTDVAGLRRLLPYS